MTEQTKVPVAKSTDEVLKQALYVVLEPDAVDAHLDTYSELEVRKACHNFNASHATANLFHMVQTNGFTVVESYITPVDMELNGVILKSGTWLVNLQFTDDDLWQAVLDGKFSGVSIGAMAEIEELE